jgi:PAS domain S-box-containing protein
MTSKQTPDAPNLEGPPTAPSPGNSLNGARPPLSDDWLAGSGETRQLIREFDWSKHEFGPPQSWPPSLKTIVRMMLDSRYAMWMGWGQELTFFYNDAYARDTLGKKHPWALGRPAREVWAEIWADIGPRIESVLRTGEATWDEGLLLFLERSGYIEETYHTFSYSPLYEDTGQRRSMLCVVTEETQRVISERRLTLLRELAANTTVARTIDEACGKFVQTLEQNPADVPFALIYLLDPLQKKASLKGAVQVPENHSGRFAEICLDNGAEQQWPIVEALATGQPVIISNLESRFGKFSGGKYPVRPQFAAVLSIPGTDAEHPVGALVLGVNPRRAMDDDYEGFFQLVAGQFATAISNAQSYEKERQRAEALVELDRAKTTFFSNVSHEFRTPLTLMLGPLEELLERDGAVSPQETRGELEVIHRNSLRLLKLVNTLLDFSRIEGGRIQANHERTDLCAFTTDLASAFRSTVQRAGLHFDVQCDSLPEPVFVDRDMWEKIVFNLLSNAFKFTLDGGISVRLGSEGGHAVLQVTDTGTGIPAGETENIFKRFHRVQNSNARSHEGTGIGLALVYELVKLHGGTISVASAPGKGSTFTVRIPFGNAHLAAERSGAPANQGSTALHGDAFVEEASRWAPPSEMNQSDQPLLSPQRTNRSGAPRILVADDNADMRDYIARLLQSRYDLETVGDGDAALEAARRQRPDVIITDVMMPGMDGFALLRAIRADPSLRTIPVIFLSARAGDEAKVEGLEEGADDYMVKPFGGRELVARLESHLKMARMRQEALANETSLREESQSIRQRLESVLSGMDEQFILLDRDWRYVYVNDRTLQTTGLSREELLGRSIWELFPAVKTGNFHDEVLRAVEHKMPGRFEFNYEPWNQWFDIRVYPTSEGVLLLATDITERVRAKEKLEQTVAERTASLRAAIAQMEEFSYSVSHDLRSPVRAMKGYASALLEDHGGKLDEQGRGYVERIIESGSRMDRLILDVLTYSRVARQDIKLQPVDLDGLTRGILLQYPEFDPSRARISIPGKLPTILGHEPSLSQIISNLLNNAVKFVLTGRMPEVIIRSEVNGDQARLWIEDNGIGIKTEYQHRLFGMFERIHPGGRYEGTGIGLAIVRKAAERMGGKAGVESDGVNGSQFWVQLPMA